MTHEMITVSKHPAKLLSSQFTPFSVHAVVDSNLLYSHNDTPEHKVFGPSASWQRDGNVPRILKALKDLQKNASFVQPSNN